MWEMSAGWGAYSNCGATMERTAESTPTAVSLLPRPCSLGKHQPEATVPATQKPQTANYLATGRYYLK